MSTQSLFHMALRDATQPVPFGLLNRWGDTAGKRFAVYRNNVAVSLRDALHEGYPATARLLGPQNFESVARGYVAEHAPTSPLMFLYGEQFAAYLAGIAPLAHLNYLPDVARLEWQLRMAYHAADAPPITEATLQMMTPDQLVSSKFRFAPAVSLLQSDTPVTQIRAYALGLADRPTGGPEHVLITRPDYDPVATPLPLHQATLILDLIKGHTLGEALDRTPDADLSALLTLLLSQNALHSFVTEATK